MKVASMARTAPESFDPSFVFSAHKPKYAAPSSIAQRSQVWFEFINVFSNKIFPYFSNGQPARLL